MKEPTVCAIMLVNGREEMVKRAIKSFREQTYQNKHLLMWNTGQEDVEFQGGGIITEILADRTSLFPRTIGELRNEAIALMLMKQVDLIAHWDSDDWSHPRRIEEQVALLQASGKQCVGFKDMLFYDTTPGQFCGAWLYRHPTKPLGTSLMYWRETWEARPFPDLPKAKGGTGEDVQWLEGVGHVAVTSIVHDIASGKRSAGIAPRMIASIHGGNTQYYNPAESERLSEGTSWKRAAEWDNFCRETMTMKL